MKKIVCDANSIIYLTKINLLKPLVKMADLILPETVVQECLKPTFTPHEDKDLIKALLKQGHIQIASNEIGESYPKLGPGEAAVLNVFERLPDALVLTDDGEVVKYCRDKRIPFLSSPFIPAVLYQKRSIALIQALKGIFALGEIGYFSKEVLHRALKKLVKSERLKGILFDLDGVLVDTMKLHDAAWRKAVRPMGLEVSAEEIYKREGEKGIVTAHDLLLKAGRKPEPESIESLLKEKERIFKKNFKIEFFPEALNCLKSFHDKGYRLGLVTGTSLGEVKTFLDSPFLDFFEVVITGDAVKMGKPHSEPYVSALKKINLSSEEVLVIENAPYGIQSARGAELACIALATSLPPPYLSNADLVLKGLDELLELFSENTSDEIKIEDLLFVDDQDDTKNSSKKDFQS
jgi:beta-phosphoglucomutase-like phosphatase (HAD superfamily)